MVLATGCFCKVVQCKVTTPGADAVPVTFRYDVAAKDSKVTHVYRPNPTTASPVASLRPQALGQVRPDCQLEPCLVR